MKQWRGLWFPDTETHLIDWMQRTQVIVGGLPAYQYGKYKQALELLPRHRRGVALDIGANVGLWARVMCLDFDEVYAFEPMTEFRECLQRNAPEASASPFALGECAGRVVMISTTPGSCGDTRVSLSSETRGLNAEMRTLDSFNFPAVDLIKIDTEGYEWYVVRGAIETLRRCRPVVIVEQKPGHASGAYGLGDRDAVKWLEDLGMHCAMELGGDFLMRW